MRRSWIKKAGMLVAAAFLLFVFGWVPYFLGGIATTRRFQYNDKENAGLTPASFDLKFEDVAFKAAGRRRRSRAGGSRRTTRGARWCSSTA